MTEDTRTQDPSGAADERASRRAASRRRLAHAGLVLLGVLLLAVLPGYLGSRSSFFGRYPSLAEKEHTWAVSTHAEAACSDCHVPPRAIPQALFRVRMVGEFYVGLVYRGRAPGVFGRPTNAACLACHNDLRSVSPKGDLQIPHRAHVQALKMRCVECHNYLVHEKSPEGKHVPTMRGCLKCHDGETAKDACSACHTEKAAPQTHRAADWLVVHPVGASDAKCAKCHGWAKNWCADCHSHRPQSHGRNWRTVHGSHVKVHRNCEACHAAPFCVRCHGEVPQENFNPALRLVK